MYAEGERVFSARGYCDPNPADFRRAGNLQAREVLQATACRAPNERVIYGVYVAVPMCHEHRMPKLFDLFFKRCDERLKGLTVRVVDGLFESRSSVKADDDR